MRIAVSDLMRRVARLRCPVCGRGQVFRGLVRGRSHCSECGYIFRRREGGYFLMAMLINYFVTIFGSLGSWLLLEFVFKVRSRTLMLSLVIAVTAALCIWFTRYARMLWMALDLTLDPPAREDFVPRHGMNWGDRSDLGPESGV